MTEDDIPAYASEPTLIDQMRALPKNSFAEIEWAANDVCASHEHRDIASWDPRSGWLTSPHGDQPALLIPSHWVTSMRPMNLNYSDIWCETEGETEARRQTTGKYSVRLYDPTGQLLIWQALPFAKLDLSTESVELTLGPLTIS